MTGRNLRFMDFSLPLYAAKTFKKDGKQYFRGDLFNDRDITNRIKVRLFQTGFLVHARDFTSDEIEKYNIEGESSDQSQLESTSTEEKTEYPQQIAEETPEVTEESEPENGEAGSKVAVVTVDTDEEFKVKYDGIEFEIARNQIREDGTLTNGGLKAYEAARG